jgi:elongation factor G
MEDLSKIRNIGVTAHIDAGKTTTTERLLFYSGTIHKMGDVDEGTTVTDFDVEEQQRGITIYSAAVSIHWRDCRINLIDTPGHVDFTAEVERSLRVLDGAVVVFDAYEGVEAQSETVWRQADKYKVPRICFINKMDKTGANFDGAVRSIIERLHANPVPIQIPMGEENSFRGFIDLIAMEAVLFEGERENTTFRRAPIPEGFAEDAAAARHALDEKIAELDDELMAHYLEHETLTADQLRAGLRKGAISLRCQPVLCGSSLKYVGVQAVLDAVCDYLPSPLDIPPVEGIDPENPDRKLRRKCSPDEPLSALVFKIVAEPHGDLFFVRVYSGVLKANSRVTNVGRRKKENVPRLFRIFAKRRDQIDEAYCGDIVALIGLKDTLTGDTLCGPNNPILLERIEFPETVISMAIEPMSSADRDKLLAALKTMTRADPTFAFKEDADTGQILISGMGELHLEVICHRLERDMNVATKTGKPSVAYRETITQAAEAEGRIHRQTGGKAQFAAVKVRVEPFTPAPGETLFRFSNRIPAAKIRPVWLPAIESGARGAAQSGALGGYPLINVQVTVLDAEESAEESSEVAFEIAAAQAVQRAMEQAGPVLLEPIMKVEVVTPEDYFGAINGDLSARRAMIIDTGMRGRNHVIEARAPLSEMFGYATSMRSLSQGRASYSMEPSHYDPMPADRAKKVLGVF